jgi:hypothetical protein
MKVYYLSTLFRQILEYRLQRGGIPCVKLSGSMNIDQRDKVGV